VPALLNALSPAVRCHSWTVTPAPEECVSAPEIVTWAPAVIGSGEALIVRLGWQTGSIGPGQQGIESCAAIGGPQQAGTDALNGQTTIWDECCRPDADATVPPATANAATSSTNGRRIAFLMYPRGEIL
jgi:hypothetical protein